MELPATSLPPVHWLFPPMRRASVRPLFSPKKFEPLPRIRQSYIFANGWPLKVSSEYCHLSSFPAQNLQLPQRSEHSPILRRFCKTGCSLSMTCIPPLSPLSPPPSQIGAKCHISTHQTCHTMCHVKDATLADNIYFAGAGSQNACWRLKEELAERILGVNSIGEANSLFQLEQYLKNGFESGFIWRYLNNSLTFKQHIWAN